MNALSSGNLIPVLQVAIGPVILVSGVGLLLLTMTNRLGRVVDRMRIVGRTLSETLPALQQANRAQLAILSERAELLRRAITLASMSVLLAALLVIVLFVTALFRLETAWVIGALFIASMVSLIGSLISFIQDLNRSLHAVRLELADRPARS